MKKITLLLVAVMFTFTATSQQVLSHSVDQTILNGAVACASGGVYTTENSWYRSYTPSDFGFSGNFEVMAAQFAVSFADNGGTNPQILVSVNAYTSDDVFPAGNLTMIASTQIFVTLADDLLTMDVPFDASAVVDADTEVALEVFIETGEPTSVDVRIGENNLGQNAPSYLASASCGITEPTDTADIGFPDAHIVLNLIGDESLGLGDNLAEFSSIYPNPVTDILNIDVPSNVEITNATLYDVLGKNTGISIVDGTMRTSELSQGIYILKVETSAGSLTQKVVKQ